MGVQPPMSPWMGAEYQERNYISKVPKLQFGEYAEQRDPCWLTDWESATLDPQVNVKWKETPDQAIRMIDHWDNFNGTVERGYSGRSVFFEGEGFREDWKLIEQYAKLLGSVRINAVSINNVNVREGARWLITNTDNNFVHLAKIANIFEKYNIKLFIAINFAAPKIVGDLDTSDPLDPKVQQFWSERAADIFRHVPNFGGFVVKADAEGEPGPYQYGRNHADGANMLARAVEPHGGLIIWRCFVYNHHQDWRVAGEYTVDRTKAAFDNFYPLDGEFADNVILQVKYGPTDFQIKEPITPLIGQLEKTNQMVEFQITQEYTGQQRHICFLAPTWHGVLNTKADGKTTVAATTSQNSPNPARSGVAAVSNVGTDANWTGHKLAQANLYAFGRLAWDASLTPEQIAKEWTALTFPRLSETAQRAIVQMLVESHGAYLGYTSPLGSPSAMCNPGYHYGPNPEGYEYDRWGIYQFPCRDGFGLDRTPIGTGFTSQYKPEVAAKFESLDTCPDELLAFFHFVRYDHILHSGKTVIEHIYDTHFAGVEKVQEFIEVWASLREEMESAGYLDAFKNVDERLEEQLISATNWRDFLNTYYYRFSGVPDEKGRKIYR